MILDPDKSTSGGLCLPNKRLSFKPLRENLLWFFQSNPKAAFSPVFSKAVHIPPRTNHLRSTAINDWDHLTYYLMMLEGFSFVYTCKDPEKSKSGIAVPVFASFCSDS